MLVVLAVILLGFTIGAYYIDDEAKPAALEIYKKGKLQCRIYEPEFMPDLQELYRIKEAGYIFKINNKKVTLADVQALKNEKKAARK